MFGLGLRSGFWVFSLQLRFGASGFVFLFGCGACVV